MMRTLFRRTCFASLVILIGLGLLTACVGQAAKTADPNNDPIETRIFVDDLDREVEIPLAPERIVVLDFSAELLELGITPVGMGHNDFKNVFTRHLTEGIEDIGDPPNAEKTLDLAPDLIIFSTVIEQIYPELITQLEKVAPIVYFSFDQDPIYDTFVKIADLVGKTDTAQQWIAEYEQEVEEARALASAVIDGETFSILRIEKSRIRVYLNRNFGGYMLYTALEAEPPLQIADEIKQNPYGSAVEISLEKLPEYTADHLFVIVRSEGDDQAEFEEIQKSALWNGLPAVQNGQVYYWETEKYYGVDIVTIRETLKETVERLTAP